MVKYSRRWSDSRRNDPYREFIERLPEFAQKARLAVKEDSSSYRGFLVGCVAFGLVDGPETTIDAEGGNLKRVGKNKLCAEQKAAKRIRSAGATSIIGLVVAGTTNPALIKDVTGLATPTLHMCEQCRIDFSDPASLANDNTIVVSTGIEDDYFQTHLLGQLDELYEQELHEELMGSRISPGFNNWGRRVALYDNLVLGEQTDIQRHRAELAQRALIAPVEHAF